MGGTVADGRRRGFYLSIDIALASAFTLLILVVLMLTLGNIPHSEMVAVGSYKNGESALYVLDHDGTLENAVQHLDDNKEGRARGEVISSLANYNLVLNPQLTIYAFDENATMIHTFVARKGPVVEQAYAMAIPFRANATRTKFGIAILRVGI